MLACGRSPRCALETSRGRDLEVFLLLVHVVGRGHSMVVDLDVEGGKVCF